MWKECEQSTKNNDVNPVCKGLLAGMLGYYDEAFELLNEAFEKRIYPLIHLETFPSAEFLKNDPRYNQLLKKMNIPSLSPMFALNKQAD